jgi:hypothetical protein
MRLIRAVLALFAFIVVCARAIESKTFVLVDVGLAQNGTPYALTMPERVALEASLVSLMTPYGVQEIEHTARDPRRVMADSSHERFEVVFPDLEKAHAFEQVTNASSKSIALDKNITATLLDVRIVSNEPMDGVKIMVGVMVVVAVFLGGIAMSVWVYSVIVRHQRSTQAEKRLAEKFGLMYKRHIGVEK